MLINNCVTHKLGVMEHYIRGLISSSSKTNVSEVLV